MALYFGAARAKLQKTRKEIKEKMLENVKDSQFKKMEFRSNGQDMRAILNKLSAMYIMYLVLPSFIIGTMLIKKQSVVLIQK